MAGAAWTTHLFGPFLLIPAEVLRCSCPAHTWWWQPVIVIVPTRIGYLLLPYNNDESLSKHRPFMVRMIRVP